MSQDSLDRNAIRGLTLLEVLIVIGIIGVVAALLLPAVMRSRESSRSSQCANQLRQLGLAMHNHEAAHGYLPATERALPLDSYPTDPPNPYLHFSREIPSYGPLLHLLPYLEQQSLYALWNLKRAWHDPVNLPPPYGSLDLAALATVPAFICPSTPSVPSDYGPYFQSIGVGGGEPLLASRSDYIPLKGVQESLHVCAGNPRESTFNGLLGTDDPLAKPTVRSSEVTDGLSHTILFAELAGKQARFFRGQQLPGNSLTDNHLTLNSFYGDPNLGRLIQGYSGTDVQFPRQEGCATINVVNASAPYAFHAGGANVVMGDGSVHFLAETISAREIVALITRDGGESAQLP